MRKLSWKSPGGTLPQWPPNSYSCALLLQVLAGASHFLIPSSEDVRAGRNISSRALLEAFVKLLSLHNTLSLAPALPQPWAGPWGH